MSTLEVVVVDDGSTDSTASVADARFPFSFIYIQQENHGGVRARNRGVEASTGELLLFLDDDMLPGPQYISALVEVHDQYHRVLSRGKLVPWLPPDCGPFARITQDEEVDRNAAISVTPFSEFASNNMAIRRADFEELGGWHQVAKGTPELNGGIWADVELAFRAERAGFCFITATEAQLRHRDYVVTDRRVACERADKVARMVHPLLEIHPAVRDHLPMFADKHPISWRKDTPAEIARKLFRQFASTKPMIALLSALTEFLEKRWPNRWMLRPLYRWLIGGYIFRGYRRGLSQPD